MDTISSIKPLGNALLVGFSRWVVVPKENGRNEKRPEFSPRHVDKVSPVYRAWHPLFFDPRRSDKSSPFMEYIYGLNCYELKTINC
jgi:hypothetical protein